MKISEYRKLTRPKEHDIQTEIINYLTGKGYYAMRLNSGMIENKYGGRVRMCPAGTPDILAFKQDKVYSSDDGRVKRARIYFIEVKRPGNKPTRLQEMKMEELSSFGAHCFVATCIEDVSKELKRGR
jgi:hypothetical protein